MLLSGVTVTVLRRERSGTDAHGNPAYGEWTGTEVGNVLPQPGGTSDLDASRPEGAKVDMTFHFPKAYAEPLKGCRLSYAGRTYRVIGDPQPYLDGLTPGEWDRPVETEAVHG